MVQTDLREIALLDRRGTNSAKWDSLLATFGQEDLLPLWVADMDFKAPKCVRDALHQAVEQGALDIIVSQTPIMKASWVGRKPNTVHACSGSGFGQHRALFPAFFS